MVFSSLVFIFAFLPVVWVVFHLLKNAKFSGHYTAAKVFLICASLFFYAYFKLEYLPILLGTIIVNFTLARLILRDFSRNSNENPSQNLNPNLSGEFKQNSNQEFSPNSSLEFNQDFNENSRATSLSLSLSLSRSGTALNSKQNSRKLSPKFYFILGIIFNLCLLGFFKYTDFLLENFNAFAKLANLDFEIPLPHILLPIALSFVTFQQIAFLFDCYKRTKGEISENLSINFIDYALFISFFPQLIAGPIVHHREMMPQFSAMGNSSLTPSLRELEKSTLDRLPALSRADFPTQPTNLAQDTRIASDFTPQNAKNSQNLPQTINYEFLAKGLFIFSIGLFKKVFIADSFAKWADAGFGLAQKGQVLNIAESWATSLSYTFQLYFDFSGYCDMAIGLGLAFGIVLPLNFNSPYKSRNIAEFWRRWHITLGRFLKECLYIPLGGNRVGKILNLRNLFIVAFLSGIWHGAGWGFVIWGVLHGVAMLAHRVYGWFVAALDSSLGSHCADFANFKGSQATQPSSPSKFAKNHESTAANTKIVSPKSKRETLNSSHNEKNSLKNFAATYLKFTQSKFYAFLSWFLTFNFISLAWIFFRAENLQGALNLLKGMFGVVWVELPSKWHRMPETLAQIGGRNDTIFYILLAILVCVFAKNSVQITRNFRSNALKFSLSLRLFGRRIYLKGGGVFVKFALTLGLFWGSVWLLCKGALSANAYTPFIYFNF